MGQVGWSGKACPTSEVGACGETEEVLGEAVGLSAERSMLALGLLLRTALPLLPQSRHPPEGSGCAQCSGPVSSHWSTLPWISFNLFSLLVPYPFPIVSVRFCLAPSLSPCCSPVLLCLQDYKPVSHQTLPRLPTAVLS